MNRIGKRFLAVMLIVLMMFTTAMPGTVFAVWDGSTANEPNQENGVYQISTEAELAWFAANATSDANAKLLADLDMGETNWTPMFANEAYAGTFDGNNKTITYQISGVSANFQGFFSQIGANGTVKNLYVAGNIEITGSRSGRNYHGGIAARNAGTITGCKSGVAISVKSSNVKYCGGIAGQNTGTIKACTNNGNISITTYAGGIVGENKGGNLFDCINNGQISVSNASGYAGGIVGCVTAVSASDEIKVETCINNGAVSATGGDYAYAGGIIGQENVASSQTGTKLMVTACENKGTVSTANPDNAADILAKQGRNCVITITPAQATSVPVTAVGISGNGKTGEKLTGEATGENSAKATNVSYQWQISKNGTDFKDIDGEAGAEFTIPENEDYVGKYIRICAKGDENSSAFSSAVGPIEKSDALKVAQAKEMLTLNIPSKIREAGVLSFPSTGENGTSIGWTSTNERIISSDGAVTLPEAGKETVTLTAEISLNGIRDTKTFSFVVYSLEATETENQDEVYLEDAKQAMEWYRIVPVFGTDTNVVTMVKNYLSSKGYGEIGVSIKESKDTATVAEDGAITYFYADPNSWQAMWFRSVSVTLQLTKGDCSAELTKNAVVHWNADLVKQTVKSEIADQIDEAVILNKNSALNEVTGDLTLPKVVDDKKWTLISWESSNEDIIEIDASGQNSSETLFNPYIGKVKQGVQDENVTLTATFTFQRTSLDEPEITITKQFPVIVKAIGEEFRQDMQTQLDSAYTVDKIKIFGTDTAIDPDNVTEDLQFPIPKNTGIDEYWNYDFSVTSNSDRVEITSYRGNVYRPLPGEAAETVQLTVTMKRKNTNLSVSKQIQVVVQPLQQSEIDQEIALMEAAKANFFEGINRGNNPDAQHITKNLTSFSEAVWENGAVKWIYSNAEATGKGIVPVSIDKSRPSEQWDRFYSSSPAVVAHENLLITQPIYDKKVTITSCLQSGTFGKYAEKYPDNADFQKLYRQTVTAEITVLGTQGSGSEAQQKVRGTFQSTGDSKHGASGHTVYQTWIPKTDYEVEDGATVLDVLKAMLAASGYSYTGGNYVASITTPGGTTLSGGDNGTMSGWMYAVNGQIANVYADQYILKEGDEIYWFFTDDIMADDRITGNVIVDPDTPLPSYAAEWEGFRGDGSNSAVIAAPTPREQAEAALKWKYTLKDGNDWSTAVSDPVMVNGNWYYAVGNELVVINQNGNKIKTGALAGVIDYTCRPVYVDGKIIVPLSQGRLQALAADSLKTVWITDPVVTQNSGDEDEIHQSLTTLTVNNGRVYMGTAVADWSASYRGIFQCVDAATGQIIWRNQNDSAGYYWAGAAIVNNAAIVAGDDGILMSWNAVDGAILDQMDVGSPVRSTVSKDGNIVYVSTTAGVLYQIEVKANGRFGTVKKVSFANYSTSTPAIYDGKVYVGGSLGEEEGYLGVLAVIDTNTMKVEQKATAPGEVKAAPLVVKRDSSVFVYFTCNVEPGGIYAIRLGGGNEAIPIYLPTGTDANYCMASVLATKDGTLYYVNDSGKLFAISAKHAIQHTVTISAGEGGSVSPEGEVTVDEGVSLAISFEPDTGYQVDEILLDGERVARGETSYTLKEIQKDHIVQVTFAKKSTNTGEESEKNSSSPESNGMESTRPKTGDSGPESLTYLILAIVAIGVGGFTIWKKRKIRQ